MHEAGPLIARLAPLTLCLPLLLASLAGPVRAASLTRGPYLQSSSPSEIVVRWRTDTTTTSRVSYGFAPGNLPLVEQEFTGATEHEIRLNGLQPGTTYFYAVGSDTEILAGDDPEHFFVTPPLTAAPQKARIWILGDSGTGNLNAQAVRDAYYGYTGNTHTDLWMMLGDNAYPSGTDAEYQSTLFDIYPEMLRKSVLWPSLGNHDASSANSPTQSGVYYDIFSLPRAAEAGGVASGTEAYYSFDYANVHFFVLDSSDTDRSVGAAMYDWLELDLAATVQDWIIGVWHHPPYSRGSHDSDDPSGSDFQLVEMRENFVPLLDDYGVDLVLSGHSHSYERSWLIEGHYGNSTSFVESMKVDPGDGRENGDGAYRKDAPGPTAHSGIVYTVAGSSGKTSGGPLDHPVMFDSINVLGSLILDLDGLRVDLSFLDHTGAIRDYLTMLKGMAPLAGFQAAPLVGPSPLTVSFTDTSQEHPTAWDWDFEDDGSSDSSLQNPVHTYGQPGSYSVRLAVANALGGDALLRPAYVCVTGGLPGGVDDLVAEADQVSFHWSAVPGAASYDVVRGSIPALRAAGGEFASAGVGCATENGAQPRFSDPGTPGPGEAWFYLARAVDCDQRQGSYDSTAPPQQGSRDGGLLGVASACGCDLANDGDADSICDAEDRCPADPANDADVDGFCAGQDNCPTDHNPDQANADGDAHGDLCDSCPLDALDDADADGLCADIDNCPADGNPGQEDADLDGVGNLCDSCPADPLNDIDVDGWCAGADNCPFLTNPSQIDGDADGAGDLCDVCPADPLDDADADGHCADQDNCPLLRNDHQADRDLDGRGDLCDGCPGTADPPQADSDGDGAGDACDCAPLDPLVRPPGEVGPLSLARWGFAGARIQWPGSTGVDSYWLQRGDLAELVNGDLGACLIGLQGPGTILDPAVPGTGQAFVYILQGYSDACGAGPLGYDGLESPRTSDNPLTCLDFMP